MSDIWDEKPYKSKGGFKNTPQAMIAAVAGTPDRPGIEPTWTGDNGEALLARLEDLYPTAEVREMTFRQLYAKVTGRALSLLRIGGQTYTNLGSARVDVFAPSAEPENETAVTAVNFNQCDRSHDKLDVMILKTLAAQPRQRFTNFELQSKTRISEKTVGLRINAMIGKGFVHRPTPHGGSQITPLGIAEAAKM